MFCHHIYVLTTERKPQNLHIYTPKYPLYQENVDDTKRVIRSYNKSKKDRQYNGQKKQD
jgi:hypothetical protein